jgi:hypothetical protein
MAGVGFKGKGQRGRRRQQLPTAVTARLDKDYSNSDTSKATAYSRVKGVYARTCSNRKHKCLAANDTLSRKSTRVLRCRVCTQQGSTYEQELYRILNHHRGVQAYAVEAHAVQGAVNYAGGLVALGRQRWDVVLLQPAGVLIAVQGEQHYSKPDTRRNSRNRCRASLEDTVARDHAVAAGAMQQCYQVVWLTPWQGGWPYAPVDFSYQPGH